MEYNFNQYDYIIIDYSAVFIRYESNLIERLAICENIFFSPTFENDCKQFLNIVSERIRNNYQNNMKKLRFSAKRICNTYGLTDTYGLAEQLSTMGSTLVIEANSSLENRLIFSGIRTDIYYWGLYIIRQNEFEDIKNSRALCQSKDPLPFYEVKSGDTVYSEKGSYVLFADLDDRNSGAESNIYQLKGCPGYLAKIYKLDSLNDTNLLTQQKYDNIVDLMSLGISWKNETDWLALPEDILYADSHLQNPIGYMMRKIKGRFMSDIPLFSNVGIPERFCENENVTVRDVLETCIRFVSQYMFLSVNGINLADYNTKNFALEENGNEKKFNMIDTDSYCYGGYVCEYPTFADTLSRDYECNDCLDVINICEESLFVYIFTLLALDPDCFPMRKDKFRFSKEALANYRSKQQYIFLERWDSFPPNLQNLYVDVFEKKRSVSVSVLLYELDYASKQSFADEKYANLYKKVFAISKNSCLSTSTDISNPPSGMLWLNVLIAIFLCLMILFMVLGIFTSNYETVQNAEWMLDTEILSAHP